MQVGFVSAILAEYSFKQVIDFASENAFSCVEIMCWPKGKAERRYAGVTHIDLDRLDQDESDKINKYLKKRGVSISALGYYPNPIDAGLKQRKVFIDHIKKCIKAANILGLKNFNTFIGKDHSRPISENMAEFKKVWPDIVKFAEDHDIKIGIENCPMYFKDE